VPHRDLELGLSADFEAREFPDDCEAVNDRCIKAGHVTPRTPPAALAREWIA